MTKEIDALETLDEYTDDQYSAFLEYVALKDQCVIEPTTLYINKNHDFYLYTMWLVLLHIDLLMQHILEKQSTDHQYTHLVFLVHLFL